jgi:hypothetical protein
MYVRIGVTVVKFGTILGRKKVTAVECGWEEGCDPVHIPLWEYSFFSFIVVKPFEKLFRLHPGRVVTVYQIGELFGNAYKRAATSELAANGFRATGIFPLTRTSSDHMISLCPQRTKMLLL